ncbi:hypothetical protein [Niabella ginsengisoli]|uniref:Uncharacterized protein n=1 Tax=Niabella ginsengisoli TaxID=522298 RepID=A0ABS9SE63_9BACT|nr:hypothetical protein [Niabella ginsengisoli]MCH5596652.1 hypothetical protein [Niabella ginsengisoli]
MNNKKQAVRHYGMVVLFCSLTSLSFAQISPLAAVSSNISNASEAVKKPILKVALKICLKAQLALKK